MCRKAYPLAGGQLLVPRTVCQAQTHLGWYWRLSPHTVFSSPGAVLGLCGSLPGAHDPFCSSLPGVLEVLSR